MPISSHSLPGLVLAAVLGATGPGWGLDVKTLQQDTPAEAFKFGFTAYQQGDMTTAFEALEFAAENGHPMAQWKLGRMYAEGDGVQEDHLKAFQLFSEVADEHADENPSAPSAPFVANAFVALGSYYRDGIPNTRIRPDFGRARQLFNYAASYFADPEAQANLALMYYEGEGGEPDPRAAVRWAKLSADKGNVAGQALLGHLLFTGEGVRRQPILGLMYLTIARERARPGDQWVWQFHEEAFGLASEKERQDATAGAIAWIQKHPAAPPAADTATQAASAR